MPMNAPPEFNEAMEKYSSARTISEKIKYLEEALRFLPKHKGTENMRKQLLRKLSELRKELSSRRKTSKGKSFLVPKQGFQVTVWGFPNSGKSYILSIFSGTQLKSTPIPFETDKPTPVMVEWGGGKVQMVELPSYMSEEDSRLNSMIFPSIRASDFLLLIIGGDEDPHYQLKELRRVLEEGGIYINRERPPLKVEKTYGGGIRILSEHLLKGEKSEFREVLHAYNIYNANVIPYGSVTPEDLALVLEEGTAFIPSMNLLNGVEGVEGIIFRGRETIDELFPSMGLIRVFTKPPRGEISKEAIIMRKGSTPEDVAEEIGIRGFKSVRLWRDGRFITVGRDYELKDGDIIELR